MNVFTKDTTWKEVFDTPEFSPYIPYIAMFYDPAAPRRMENLTLSCFGEVGGRGTAYGFNRLLENLKSGRKIVFPLSEADEKGKAAVLFHFPAIQKKSRKFALVLAGGGYRFVCSASESFPIAARLSELGYESFVLHYRCGEGYYAPAPLDDLSCAVRFILDNRELFGVDTEGYSVIGLSAGAHLVATLGTDNLGYPARNLPKPGMIGLAYPVITMGDLSHSGSREALFGPDHKEDPAMIEAYSIEKHVTPGYPPVFLWQCSRDSLVPIANSQMMAKALEENGVPFVYETYDSDVHGWGFALGEEAEGWVDRATDFWEKQS